MNILEFSIGIGGWMAVISIFLTIASHRIDHPSTAALLLFLPFIMIAGIYVIIHALLLFFYVFLYILAIMFRLDILIIFVPIGLGTLLMYTLHTTYRLIEQRPEAAEID